MTNDEFNKSLLDKKINFRQSEAARMVLVHGISIETAAVLAGLRGEGEAQQVVDAVSLFKSANKNHPQE